MKAESTHLALLTDLYELTMAAVYYQRKMFAPATFSLFVRKYPTDRGYFVSAGLEEVLEFLESFRFTQEDLDYLSTTCLFSPEFLQYLGDLRFTGDVFAMPEGRLFFKDEPVLEITAPMIEAQLVETLVINLMNFPILVAGKAARCVHASKGRKVIDFSLRRTQGPDAGMAVARSGYIVGVSGTSNVMAGKLYDIPITGTMAHSFVTSFDEEIDSFRAFAEIFPDNTVLLIDTYDTLSGAHKAVTVAGEMMKQGKKLRGVRLDSGDLVQLSKEVGKMLREAGLSDVLILASGGLDEHQIAEILEQGAQIDAFAVGTKMGVSSDAPYLDIAYKLVQYDGRPVLKLSSEKKTLVSEKQVFRTKKDAKLAGDVIALRHEHVEGEPLLDWVMKGGKRLYPPEPLNDIRDRFRNEFADLDDAYKRLEKPELYPVKLGSRLQELQEEVIRRVKEKELGES